ncbi:hypothetical protein BYT27DRAFT_7185754 [Phlegmacium glaucopus]|nr:hypothetical protein BYT27DRAFT_7185754 [Phlegmacium glaucopus]
MPSDLVLQDKTLRQPQDIYDNRRAPARLATDCQGTIIFRQEESPMQITMPVIRNAIVRIAVQEPTGYIHKHIFQQSRSWGPSVFAVAGA